VFTHTGVAADMVAKYRPPCLVLVASDSPEVLRAVGPRFGLLPCPLQEGFSDTQEATRAVIDYARCDRLEAKAGLLVVVETVVCCHCMHQLHMPIYDRSCCETEAGHSRIAM
jgi:pyruvate kinase